MGFHVSLGECKVQVFTVRFQGFKFQGFYATEVAILVFRVVILRL